MRIAKPRTVWLALSAVVILVYLLTPGWPELQFWTWWTAGTATTALIAVMAATKRPWSGSSWWLVAAATALIVISEIAERATNFGQSANPTISPEHILDAVATLLLICSTLILSSGRRHDTTDPVGLLDSAVVLVAGAIAASEFLLYPVWTTPSIGLADRLFLTALAILGLVLLATTTRLWFSTDWSANRSTRTLAISIFVLLLGPALTAGNLLPTDTPTPLTVGIAQSCALLFFCGAGLAMLDPTAARPPVGEADSGSTSRLRVLLVLALCGLVPLFLALKGNNEGFTSSRVFVVMTLLLVALFGFRISLLISSYVDAVRREHTLSQINAGLMRVTSVADIDRALDGWVSQLVEQPDVSCVHDTADALSARGIGAFGTRLRAADGRVRYRNVVSVAGTTPPRRLVIDTPEVIGAQEQGSLGMFGQSIGMAMERLALAGRLVEQEATERLDVLLHHASDVIALVDDDGGIAYVTEAIRDLTKLSPRAIVGRPWTSLFQEPTRAQTLLNQARVDIEVRGDLVMATTAVVPQRPSGVEEPAGNTDRNATKERRAFPTSHRLEVDVVWLWADRQFVVTHHDVTERYELERQLAYQAFHDELTGLSNRVVFRAGLRRAADRSSQTRKPFAVMMLDLDDFKDINDSLGHPAGDDLLRVVGQRLTECMREGDTPVRLGGDEFAVILESTESLSDAQRVGARILDSLRQPVQLRGTQVNVSVSIGIAAGNGATDPTEIERDADTALYEAKYSGKGRLAVFHSSMRDASVRTPGLAGDLHNALKRSQFIVRYQPVFELASGRIAGIEAHVRWLHPDHGELHSGQFVPAAERTGDIIDIGRVALARSLADLSALTARFPQHGGLRLCLKVPARRLVGDGAAAELAAALTSAQIPPERVVFQVDEGLLLPDEGVATTQLRQIADLGTSIYVSDFSTGWASLRYLRTLPISGVKLAGGLVDGLPAKFETELALAILDLCQSLGLEDPVADGIGRPAQRETLVRLGYHLGQGSALSEPMLMDELEILLTSTEPGPWPRGPNDRVRAQQKSQP
ncbi:MAG: diguanylate cyclase [Actinomycetes bacterium]